jgi:hypothetical protein
VWFDFVFLSLITLLPQAGFKFGLIHRLIPPVKWKCPLLWLFQHRSPTWLTLLEPVDDGLTPLADCLGTSISKVRSAELSALPANCLFVYSHA